MAEYRELILGCGNSRKRAVRGPDDPADFQHPTTLDIDPNCGADIIFDLERVCAGGELPFDDNTFDEIHAYDVLEHIGQQGDWKGFFRLFSEFYRILKPAVADDRGDYGHTITGRLIGKSPALSSPWLWGDPGHRNVISVEKLSFLCQPEYTKQTGKTSMCDYRHFYRDDFAPVHFENNTRGSFVFVIAAVKPSRISV